MSDFFKQLYEVLSDTTVLEEVIEEEGSPVVDGADAVSTACRHVELSFTERFNASMAEFFNRVGIISLALGMGVLNFAHQMWKKHVQKKRATSDYAERQIELLNVKNEHARELSDLQDTFEHAERYPFQKNQNDFYLSLNESVQAKKNRQLSLLNKMKSNLQGDTYALRLVPVVENLDLEKWNKLPDSDEKFAEAKKVYTRLINNDALYEIQIGKKIQAAEVIPQVANSQADQPLVEKEAPAAKVHPLRKAWNKVKGTIELLWQSAAIYISVFWVVQWVAGRFTEASLLTKDFASMLPEEMFYLSLLLPVVVTIVLLAAGPVVSLVTRIKNKFKGKSAEKENDLEAELSDTHDFKPTKELADLKQKLVAQQFAKSYYDELRFVIKQNEVKKIDYNKAFKDRELTFDDLPEPAKRLVDSHRNNSLIAYAVSTGFLFGLAIVFGLAWPLGAFASLTFAAFSIPSLVTLGSAGVVGGIRAWLGGKAQQEENDKNAALVKSKHLTLAKLNIAEQQNEMLRKEIKELAKHKGIKDLTSFNHGMPLEGKVQNDHFWRALDTKPVAGWKKPVSYIREAGLKCWTLSYATRAYLGFWGFGAAFVSTIMAPVAGLVAVWGTLRAFEYKLRKGAENDLKYVEQAEERLEAAERENEILQTMRNDIQAGKKGCELAPEVSKVVKSGPQQEVINQLQQQNQAAVGGSAQPSAPVARSNSGPTLFVRVEKSAKGVTRRRIVRADAENTKENAGQNNQVHPNAFFQAAEVITDASKLVASNTGTFGMASSHTKND